MSSSESTSDSETSYQSEDSDVNFIPGYVVIEDAGINNDGNIAEEESDDTDVVYVLYRCKCGNCGINLLANSHECLCCSELEGCEEALKNEEVLEDLKAEGLLDVKCITQHPGFSQVCLQKWSLKLAADKYKTKSKSRYRQEGTENR